MHNLVLALLISSHFFFVASFLSRSSPVHTLSIGMHAVRLVLPLDEHASPILSNVESVHKKQRKQTKMHAQKWCNSDRRRTRKKKKTTQRRVGAFRELGWEERPIDFQSHLLLLCCLPILMSLLLICRGSFVSCLCYGGDGSHCLRRMYRTRECSFFGPTTMVW